MPAANINFTLEQGATFKKILTLTNKKTGDAIDLTTGTDIQMQLREDHDSTTILLDITLANGRAVFTDKPGGVITIDVAPSITAAITKGGVYDLEVTFADGSKRKYLRGRLNFELEVTK